MTEFDFSEKGLLRLAEKTDRRLGKIAAKPAIAKIMSEYGMTTDPLARGANSLYEHFLFLLRCQMTSDIAFGAISNPGSFRLSLELRQKGASQEQIGSTFTDDGRAYQSGSLPIVGRIIPWLVWKTRRLLR